MRVSETTAKGHRRRHARAMSRRMSSALLLLVVLVDGARRPAAAQPPLDGIVGPPVATPAPAAVPWMIPPVDAPIGRRYEQPGTQWGPGHRGVDYYVAAGTMVRAAGDGRVAFAGAVANKLAVTIDHGDGVLSSYSELDEILVRQGTLLRAGAWIGRTGATHAGGRAGLHFSVRLGGRYVDPIGLVGPVDPAAAMHLVPVAPWGSPAVPEWLRPVAGVAGTHVRDCTAMPDLDPARRAPNDNIALAVAGLGSRTAGGLSAAIYERGVEQLGFPKDRTYHFSYEGTGGPRLHEPYEPAATLGAIDLAARKLEEQLELVARLHPGRDVDLIAHSQGGIVARTFLQSRARSWNPRLPRVAHLVTFSSPHQGAPGAALALDLQSGGLGRAISNLASAWSRSGGPVPDPYSMAVAQLAPGSALMGRLAAADVSHGTRVLTLGAPDDVVVPPHRASIPGEAHHVVSPSDGLGHEAVVSSPEALAIAHGFLRDAAPVCRGAWDQWGPVAGRAVEGIYRSAPWAVRAMEAIGGGGR